MYNLHIWLLWGGPGLWRPLGAPTLAQAGSKMVQDAPKRAQVGPKMAQNCLKVAQAGPQEGSRWPQDGPHKVPKSAHMCIYVHIWHICAYMCI